MPGWITNLTADAGTLAPAIVVTVGAVIALTVVVLIWRALRKQEPDKLAVKVAVLLASAFSAQGMYEVATHKLDFPWYLASGLFVVAEAGMLASAYRAHRHFEKTGVDGKPGRLGANERFVWIIAAAAGIVVSLNSNSASEYVLRLLMPLLVAGLWRMGYVAEDARERAADAITLRWTPRRLGVRLGIIEPGERDLATVNAQRQVRQMTAHAYSLHRGSPLRSWHASRLRRLGLAATDDVIAQVQASVERVHYIEDSTAPKIAPGVPVDLPAWWSTLPWNLAKRSTRAMNSLHCAQLADRESTRVETDRLATRIRQLEGELLSTRERTFAIESAIPARVEAARVEGERAARTEASREIESLREALARPRPHESSRPANRTSGNAPARRGQQVVATIGNDDEVADVLYEEFAKRVDGTGEFPSGHWVHSTGTELMAKPVWSRQANRVVEILKARYNASGGSSESTSRESDDSADDEERELVGATA